MNCILYTQAYVMAARTVLIACKPVVIPQSGLSSLLGEPLTYHLFHGLWYRRGWEPRYRRVKQVSCMQAYFPTTLSKEERGRGQLGTSSRRSRKKIRLLPSACRFSPPFLSKREEQKKKRKREGHTGIVLQEPAAYLKGSLLTTRTPSGAGNGKC